MRYGDLFTGFGGATIGAKAVGLTPVWGIEHDDEIAAVASRNLGKHVVTADVLSIDPSTLPAVDVLHASPPCPNFSTAKTDGKETDLDVALARRVAQFVDVLRPRIFTLENVYAYRNSESWAILRNTLYECGYWMDLAHVNFADLGVPQTRKRMIVRAIRGSFVPYLPPSEPWIGWYSSIEDLIPTLPDSQFAPWQLARLPDHIGDSAAFHNGNPQDHSGNEYGAGYREASEPFFTVTANHNQANLRAFLMSNAKTEFGDGTRAPEEPALSVTTQSAGRVRAFLVGGANTSSTQAAPGVGISTADEPSRCVNASNSQSWRAFLIKETSTMEVRAAHEPCAAQVASERNIRQRAWLACGRVVSMTPRSLARFQSFPDWYELPDRTTLACKGIGNAIPPLGYQKIVQQLIEYV